MPKQQTTRHPGIRVYRGKRGTRYQVQCRRNGRLYSKSFSKLADAKKWQGWVNAELDNGRDPEPQTGVAGVTTLADVIRLFCADPANTGINADTIRQLNWWRDNLGTAKLADLSRAQVLAARLELQTSGRKGQRSNATVNRYLAGLSVVLSYAQAHDYMAQRFSFSARGGAGIKLSEPKGRDRHLDADEQARLLGACKAESETLHALVMVALCTGARAGELLKLTWGNVDLAAGYAIARDTKNTEHRRIYLSSVAINELQQLNKVRPLHDDRVFAGYNYRLPFERALAVAGIDSFRFHDLRHTAASNLAMNGATLAEIAAVLGHKSLSMVQRYSHLTDTHVSDVVARMNAKVFGT